MKILEQISRIILAVVPAAVYFVLHAGVSSLLEIFAGGWTDAGMRTVLSAGVCLCLFLYQIRKEDPRICGLLGKRPASQAGFRPALGLLSFLAGAALSCAFGRVMSYLGLYEHFSNEAQEQLLRMPLFFQLAGLGLVVPLAEEVVYRGMCYTRARQFLSVHQAALLIAVIFSLSHGNILQILYAFPMSLILTACFERGKSLWYPVLLHAGANLAAVLLSL